MGRKTALRYTVWDALNGASSFNNKAVPTEVLGLDNVGVQIVWTGSLVGIIKILVSNDLQDPTMGKPIVNWSELNLGATVAVDGTNSDIIINLNQVPWKWVAIDWTYTSGTGTLTAQLASKVTGA